MNLHILGCQRNALALKKSLFHSSVAWIIVTHHFWHLTLKIIPRCKLKRESWLRNSLSSKVNVMVRKIRRIWTPGPCHVYFMVICDVIARWDLNSKSTEADFLLNLYMFISNINYKRLHEMFYFRNTLRCNDVIISHQALKKLTWRRAGNIKS